MPLLELQVWQLWCPPPKDHKRNLYQPLDTAPSAELLYYYIDTVIERRGHGAKLSDSDLEPAAG